MRICHVIDYFHTDVGYQEFFLAREQATAGHDVRVISSAFRQHTWSNQGPTKPAGWPSCRLRASISSVCPDAQLGHDRTWIRGLVAPLRTTVPTSPTCTGRSARRQSGP